MLTGSCSCESGRGKTPVVPMSELIVERMDNNRLPLNECHLTEDDSTLAYTFFAKDCMCSSGVLIISDQPQGWTVTVNGSTVAPHERLHLTGPADGCYFLEDRLQSGENTVVFRRTDSSATAPVATVAGDFSVDPLPGDSWCLMPSRMLGPGSWEQQGMPFYTKEVSYSRSFAVPDRIGRRTLRLGKWAGRECEVWINGQKAGVLSPGKEKLSVGRFLTPGEDIVDVLCFGSGEGDCGLFEEYTIE